MKRIHKYLWIVIAMCLLLGCAGCGKQPEAAVTEAPTVPEETVAQTLPEETAPVETVQEETEPEIVEEPVAQYIETGVAVTLDGADITKQMVGTGYTLPRTVRANQKLVVESEKPFCTLYVEWGTLPSVYSLVWNGGSLECGAEGFLHDYIRLPEAVTSLSFVFEEETSCSIQTLRVYTYGVAPEGVQDFFTLISFILIIFP